MPEKITVEETNRLSEHVSVERFGSLYEHLRWVAEERLENPDRRRSGQPRSRSLRQPACG
jgi:2-oxo-4-hydroxy-4-carboxy--5-ureidoimidazoline (OHCU) decarboxylase